MKKILFLSIIIPIFLCASCEKEEFEIEKKNAPNEIIIHNDYNFTDKKIASSETKNPHLLLKIN